MSGTGIILIFLIFAIIILTQQSTSRTISRIDDSFNTTTSDTSDEDYDNRSITINRTMINSSIVFTGSAVENVSDDNYILVVIPAATTLKLGDTLRFRASTENSLYYHLLEVGNDSTIFNSGDGGYFETQGTTNNMSLIVSEADDQLQWVILSGISGW